MQHGQQSIKTKSADLPWGLCEKKPMMNKMDFVPMMNVMPFGACKVTKGPCVPAISGPWLKAHEDTIITDAAAITMDSFLVCTVGA